MSHSIDTAKPADITSKWLHDHVYDHESMAFRMSLDTPFAIDSVFENGEAVDTAPGGYKGMIVGGYTSGTNVFTSLTFNEDNRLRVDAEVTIQSVELEVETSALDGDTMGIYGFINADPDSTPIPFNLTSSGALRTVPGFIGIEDILYSEEELEPDEELIVLNHLVTSGVTYHALNITCSGDSDGVFTLLKNGHPVSKKRTSWANRNVDFNYSYGFTLNAGDSLEISVKNIGDTTSAFNASMYGEVLG